MMVITILCVDKCKNQHVLYEQELGFEGYQVITAADGREALDKVQWLHPDIIIMDINSPQLDDLESIGRIIGKNRNDPIVIHTAYGNQGESLISWAVDAYIIKSPDLTELKIKIRELLNEELAFEYNETVNTKLLSRNYLRS